MATFQGGDIQLVKPGDELYFDKPVKINEHGNNAAIKVHILDDETMKLNGFKYFGGVPTRPQDVPHWYFCKSVHEDITFNMTIYSEDDWRIDILDEWFCQPYDYQSMYERGNYRPVVLTVMENVNEIMESFLHKGIISGWKVGDYV